MTMSEASNNNNDDKPGSARKYSLDDLIGEMQHRPKTAPVAGTAPAVNGESGVFSAAEESHSSHADADLYAQLEQKERDLMLAAELGKALLDKNEELSRQNERIAEDFSVKLEVGQKT